MAIKYFDIKWWEYVKPGNTFLLGKGHRVRIEREVIPVIFVPGVMGSRLKKKTGEKVWDPDDKGFMLKTYGLPSSTPKKRKSMLIGGSFGSSYLEVIEDDNSHNREKFGLSYEQMSYDIYDPCESRTERGWGGVMWGSYSKIMLNLETRRWPDPVGNCFDFPVHAFGYNWTDTNYNSGKKLAKYIQDTIKKYKDKEKRECKYVILVTHSMGGMVARAACKLHGAESNVLGVIHGAQPSTGAAAGYWRIKAGFERNGIFGIDPMAWVLGTNGEEVTCILGNSPGGLELLPNKHYRDNKGNTAWLHVPKQNGAIETFPKSGNPYDEIYRKQESSFWRMVNPDWLDPVEGGNGNNNARLTNLYDDAWGKYEECLGKAKNFHEKLGVDRHDRTYQFYSTGVDTVDHISFSREALTIQTHGISDELGNVYNVLTPSRKSDYRGEYQVYTDKSDQEVADFRDATSVVKMALPKNCGKEGDGTVPISSSKSLEAKATVGITKTMHQDYFNDGKAREFAYNAIWNLAQARITEVIGK